MNDAIEQALLEHAGDGMSPPCDPTTEETYPTLWWFLTRVRWSDGTPRLPSTIQVDRIAGAYRVALLDHSLHIQKRLVVATWNELLPSLEEALKGNAWPWEAYKSYRQKVPKVLEAEKKKPSRTGRR